MSIPPPFTTACDLALRMPAMVAGFLEMETRVGRRFREESISDVIVASLLNLPGDDVIVVVPNELKTGSDFDIVVVDPATKDAVQFRIQAKRLTPHMTEWELGTYKELAHPHNTGKQASTLIRSSAHEAIPTIPLYAFYNPEGVCSASGGEVTGVALANGKIINAMIKLMIKAKPKRLPFKRLQMIRPLFFSLSEILCPAEVDAGDSLRQLPSPRASRRAVERAIEERSYVPTVGWQIGLPERERIRTLGDDRDTSGSVDVIRRLPAIIERAIERRGEARYVRAKVPRPRVILISDADPQVSQTPHAS